MFYFIFGIGFGFLYVVSVILAFCLGVAAGKEVSNEEVED